MKEVKTRLGFRSQTFGVVLVDVPEKSKVNSYYQLGLGIDLEFDNHYFGNSNQTLLGQTLSYQLGCARLAVFSPTGQKFGDMAKVDM